MLVEFIPTGHAFAWWSRSSRTAVEQAQMAERRFYQKVIDIYATSVD